MKVIKHHLTRLDKIWVKNPVFFITTCTQNRMPILTRNGNPIILIKEWELALDKHGWAVGRYVVLPDHVHFFCSPCEAESRSLSGFLQQWKQWSSKRILKEAREKSIQLIPPIWQDEFFDHLIRSNESYEEKWEYVKNNPVRAGFVKNSEEWCWQGEICEF